MAGKRKTKTVSFSLRLNAAKREFCERGADIAESSFSEFLVDCAVARTEQLLDVQYLDWLAEKTHCDKD